MLKQAGTVTHLSGPESLCDVIVSRSKLQLLARDLENDDSDKVLLETFPPVPVQVVTQLAIVVHLAPAIPSPLTSSHVDQEIAVVLIVVHACVVPIVRASTGWEAVDHALRRKGNMCTDPRLVAIQLLQGVLLLVRPVHVLLLVGDRVPPHVEQAVSPCTAPNKERAEIEARAILREDKVDGIGVAIANGGTHFGVEVRVSEGVGDV